MSPWEFMQMMGLASGSQSESSAPGYATHGQEAFDSQPMLRTGPYMPDQNSQEVRDYQARLAARQSRPDYHRGENNQTPFEFMQMMGLAGPGSQPAPSTPQGIGGAGGFGANRDAGGNWLGADLPQWANNGPQEGPTLAERQARTQGLRQAARQRRDNNYALRAQRGLFM